jgi:hypothetical protein
LMQGAKKSVDITVMYWNLLPSESSYQPYPYNQDPIFYCNATSGVFGE